VQINIQHYENCTKPFDRILHFSVLLFIKLNKTNREQLTNKMILQVLSALFLTLQQDTNNNIDNV
jgi:hypothetical protein